MLVVNNMTELFDSVHMVNKVPSTAFVREHNIKIFNAGQRIHFVELNDYTCYTFNHLYNSDLIGIIRELFKIDDVDLAMYLIIHTCHKAMSTDEDGLAAVITHPIYSQFVNTNGFRLEIGQWYNAPIFSPFVKEKPQNLSTRITPSKLVKAILAGQIEKVICNGNHTDNWGLDQDENFWQGEWDIFDFADKIWNNKRYIISRSGNIIHVWWSAYEWSESYTVYIKDE